MINIQLSELDLSLEVADIDDLAVILDDTSSVGLQGPILFGPNPTPLDFGQLDLDLLGFPYQGNSAYQIAVSEGFTGTAAEWLASLVGPESPNAAVAQAASAAAALSATSAQNHANAAELSKTQAATSATQAAASATAAANNSTQSLVHRTAAENVATAVALLEQQTEAHVTNAEQFAAASQVSSVAAETARSGAEASETSAATSSTSATASAASASNSATLAVNAQTAAGDAAAAAVLSASTASSAADDASSYADASQISQIAATAAREESEIAAAASVIHRDSAEAFADAAESSATVSSEQRILAEAAFTGASGARDAAEGFRDEAETYAGASLTHSQTASGYADDAGAFAEAADEHRIAAAASFSGASNAQDAAEGFRDVAQGHAEAASDSAETAEAFAGTSGSNASAASSSAISAASSYRNTVISGGNSDFSDGLTGWSWNPDRTVSASTYVPGWLTHQASFQGRPNVIQQTTGNYAYLYTDKLWPVQAGRTYRIRASIWIGAVAPSQTYIGMRALDSGGAAVTGNGGHIYNVSGGGTLAANQWHDLVSTPWTISTYSNDIKNIQLLAFLNYGVTSGASSALDGIWLEDITESTSANNSAVAAAGSASSADTFATEAGNSAEAANSSAVAAESSYTAADSAADSAANSAAAAADSASSAETEATNAGNSASAASASAVSAASSFTNTVLVEGNTHFRQGLTGYTGSLGSANWTAGTYDGRSGGVVYVNAGTSAELYTEKVFPIDTSRKYRVRGEVYASGGGGTLGMYVGLRCIDANGNVLSSNPGSYMYAASTSVVAGSGWQIVDSMAGASPASGPITGEGTGTWKIFAPGTKGVQLLCLMYDGSVSGVKAVNWLELEDITESQAALSSANAAATQFNNAQTQAGLAGASASAASGFATAAETQAGLASASAGTASTQASNASASAASASSSATLSATVANRSLMQNAAFTSFSTNGIPAGWYDWSSGSGTSVAGEAGGYAYRLSGGAGQEAGAYQDTAVGTIMGSGYYVIEARVRLDAGTFTGAMLLAYGADNSMNWQEYSLGMYFPTHPDVNGNVIGNGVIGRTYSFSRLVQVHANTQRIRLYTMSHYSGYGSIAAANQLTWFLASVRPATSAEIAAGVTLPAAQADITALQAVTSNGTFASAASLSALSATVGTNTANIATTNAVAVDALNTADALYGVTLNVNGYVSGFSSTNNGATTSFNILADKFGIKDPAGSNSVEYIDGTWRIFETGSSTRHRHGIPFGGIEKIIYWVGASSIPIGAETKANADVFISMVAPRFGGTATSGSNFLANTNVGARLGVRGGAGSVTTASIVISHSGETGAVTYQWTRLPGGSTITIQNPTAASTTFSGTLTAGETKEAAFSWSATDAGSGRTVSGIVNITLISEV